MRRLLAVVSTCIAFGAAVAAPLSATARIEIDRLMSELETKGCTFSRNGAWYSGTEAKAHLLRKLKYLEDRGDVQSTEQFISLAASASSATGQPYLVRCGHGDPVSSGAWLKSQLQNVRSTAGAVRAP